MGSPVNASGAKIARHSFECPIVKRVETVMRGNYQDVTEALKKISDALDDMPEATATRALIKDLLKVGAA
jgi:hypothetical protein